jgi:hypothetical protein
MMPYPQTAWESLVLQVSTAAQLPPTSPALLWLLNGINLRRFAQALAGFGVTEPHEIRILTDEELVSIGMCVVHVRQLRALTGPVSPEAGIPVQQAAIDRSFGPLQTGGHHAEQAPASKSKRERVRRDNANFQLVNAETAASMALRAAAGGPPPRPPADGTLDDAQALDAEAAAMARAAMARDAASMVVFAHEAKRLASRDLANALAKCRDHEVNISIQFAKDCVDDPDGSPEIAAKALKATSHALADCPRWLRGALYAAQKLVRDYLIWRIQLRTDLGDRPAFLLALKNVVGKENWNSDSYSLYMHCHSKAVRSRFAHAFPSNAKISGMKRKSGVRPARTRPKNKPDKASGNEEERTAEEELFSQLQHIWDDIAEPLAETSDFPPPPGLDSDSDSNSPPEQPGFAAASTQPGSAAAWLDAGRGLEAVSAKATGVIGTPLRGPHTFVHSAARTVCEGRRVCDLHGEAHAAEREDRRILVLSDLNRHLVWREYDGASRTESESGLPLNERHRVHFRPGALELVAELVQNPNCCFAIVSSMGLFHASPCLRLLLQQAIPYSEWVVDETLDGKWTDYKTTYTIKDMQLRWENDVNDQQGDCRETLCLDLKYKTERTFVVEWYGEVYIYIYIYIYIHMY